MTEQLILEMIDARLSRMESRLDDLTSTPAHCELHAEKLAQLERRTDSLESLAGKQAGVAAILGTIGAALALLVKHIVDGGGR